MDALNSQSSSYLLDRLPKYKRPGEPEHYRLSATQLAATKRQPPTTLVVRRALEYDHLCPFH